MIRVARFNNKGRANSGVQIRAGTEWKEFVGPRIEFDGMNLRLTAPSQVSPISTSYS